jgi:hypothetical protein
MNWFDKWFKEITEYKVTKLDKPVKVKVVDTLPNMLGRCELKLGSIVKIDAVQYLGDSYYYHIAGKDDGAWYLKSRFVPVK